MEKPAAMLMVIIVKKMALSICTNQLKSLLHHVYGITEIPSTSSSVYSNSSRYNEPSNSTLPRNYAKNWEKLGKLQLLTLLGVFVTKF